MKDQDYIKIMDRISKNKIEEAFMWNASAQKNRRSIRRLSMGIGAIAAAIAVVIGGIGYNYRDRLHANPGDESSDAQRNILGGHGELRGFVGTDGNTLFRDDSNYYLPVGYSSEGSESATGATSADSLEYLQWSVNGSSGVERHKYDGRLLTDGEQVYTCHDNQVFVTDGCGNETFFSAAPWQPCRIQKLCEGWYFLNAFVEDSWIDGEPKPYALLDKNGEGIYPVDYGNVCSDGKNLYYSDFDNQVYAAPLNDISNASIVADLSMREDYKQAPEWPEQELQEWTIKDSCIYSLHASPVATDPVSLMSTELHESSDGRESIMVLTTSMPYSDAFQKCHLLNDRMYQFTAKYKLGGTGLVSRDLAGIEETDYFVEESESLWESDPTGEMYDFILFDTGDYIIFTLPKDGKNGEHIVQVNKETGEYQYFGENYAPEQPPTAEQTDEAQESAETVPQEDSGFCSPDVFSLYYIPQEHLDTENIVCYRMLPAVKASESRFDADVLGKTLPQGGGFIPDPNEVPHISIEEAKDIILNSVDPTDTSEIYLKLSNAANGYAGKYPYDSIQRVGYEFWLSDDGSEFIVAFSSYANEQESIEYVYFRYDAKAGQYAYQYIPERTRGSASAEDSTETNFLGGKGKLRLFRYTSGSYLNAEDDTYFYDLSNSMRARKTGGDTEYETFTLPGLTETGAEQHFFITDGMNLVSLDDVLYEINPDGSLSEVLSMAEVTEDQYGNPTENIRFSTVAGFSQDASGRPTKLSLYLTGHTIGDPYVPQGPIGRAILDLKTGKLSYMESFSTLHETVIVSENAVYSGIIAGAKPQLQTAQLRKYYDGDTYDLIDTSGWDFCGNLVSVSEDDGTVTFMNPNSQYCKGNLKDGSCTVIADVPTDILCNILPTVVPGMQKIICTTGSNKRVILCNPDGSDQIILKQAGASTQQLITRGMYIENGVIHLTVAEMLTPASESQMPGEIDHVITIDGDNVSSYAISFPS